MLSQRRPCCKFGALCPSVRRPTQSDRLDGHFPISEVGLRSSTHHFLLNLVVSDTAAAAATLHAAHSKV